MSPQPTLTGVNAGEKSLVQDFSALVHTRHDCHEHAAAKLDDWLVAAEHSRIAELRGFAGSVRRDCAAVMAALLLDWSQGQIEGQIDRLKTLKWQMYGRASFPLAPPAPVVLRLTTDVTARGMSRKSDPHIAKVK